MSSAVGNGGSPHFARGLLFPGVGAQLSGMGRELLDRHATARQVFEEASLHAGIDLVRLCTDAACKEQLARPIPAQLALFTYGVAVARVLLDALPSAPEYAAGHSLGELTALCAAGALTLADGVALVKVRGQIIEEIAARQEGTMVWVLRLRAERVQAVCASLDAPGEALAISAFDAPDQLAISGSARAIAAAVTTLEQLGALVYPLRLPGPYHSPAMAEASRRFAEVLSGVALATPRLTVLSAVDATAHAGGADSRDKLARQLSSPLRWTDVVTALRDRGVGCTIEVGPKSILSFLVAKTSPRMKTWVVDRDVGALCAELAPASFDAARVIERCLRAATTTRATLDVPPDPLQSTTRALHALLRQPTAPGAQEALQQVDHLLALKGLSPAARRFELADICEGRALPGA